MNAEAAKSPQKAMHKNLESNVCGLDRAGLNEEMRNSKNQLKHVRIVQRNGKIIGGEDFSVLDFRQQTPIKERPKTRQELYEKRKE